MVNVGVGLWREAIYAGAGNVPILFSRNSFSAHQHKPKY